MPNKKFILSLTRWQDLYGCVRLLHLSQPCISQFYITKCSREGEDSHLHSPIISRLSEIYLNRAEAYAKLGNYSAALADLNTIRERSISVVDTLHWMQQTPAKELIKSANWN